MKETVANVVACVGGFFTGAFTTLGLLAVGLSPLVAFIVGQVMCQSLIWGQYVASGC